MISGAVAPIIAIASVGFVWRLAGRAYPREFISTLVMNISGPCLVVSSLSHVRTGLHQFADVGLASIVALTVAFSLAFGLIKGCNWGRRSYLPMLVFGNSGNLGLSVCYFALGPQGLALGTVYFVINLCAQILLIPALLLNDAPWSKIAKSPIVYAGLVGTALMWLGLELPQWAQRAGQTLGATAIPLMLISLGHTLADFDAHHLRAAFRWAILRLAVGLAAGIAAVWLFALHGTPAAVVIIEASMPTAVFTYLMAEKYGGASEMTAHVIFLSTLMYIGVLPLLLALVA